VNDHSIVGNELHINYLESDHPAWTLKANGVLKPDEHLNSVLDDLKQDILLEQMSVPFHHHVSFSVYIVGGIIILTLIIASLV